MALHGSWNRTRKDGYKVVSLHWGAGGRIEERDFLTGFLGATDDDVIGRPVDVAEGPDGVGLRLGRLRGLRSTAWRGARPAGVAGPRRRGGGRAREPRPPTSLAPRGAARAARPCGSRHACAACHDPKAAAPGMVTRPLAGLAQRYDAATLAAYLRTPQPPMPAFDLSDAERGGPRALPARREHP